jgi:leukotriene A-4 hydrolase/aminopeptidase
MRIHFALIFTLSTMANLLIARDQHTFARPEEVVVRHLSLQLNLDFDQKIASGSAKLDLDRKTKSNQVILDTRNLDIQSVTLDDGRKATFKLGDEVPFLGRPLTIELLPETKSVTVNYKTTKSSDAVQWLDPEQTFGKKHPFLFTQGQAILTRTWIPLQDSPGIRFTWDATITLPKDLMAVMSGTNPQSKNSSGEYKFRMELPVPAYLIALSAGDLQFSPIGKRCGVYAEPEQLQQAASEFSDMEKMLIAAEKLYGPYIWGRYDVIVLPPSFPFGGMENPRLTFATPTIIAGDGSLTSLIAHELAHSWSGNLVTNSTWDDFWLNEGFTVYFERRIMESLYGKDYAMMLSVLGFDDLKETLEELKDAPEDTKLKLKLEGRDPDDGMSDIAYEKGCLLLEYLEDQVGRDKFDQFLTAYFKEFTFKGMDTDKFIKYAKKKLALTAEVEAVMLQFIFEPGLPSVVQSPASAKFAAVEKLAVNFQSKQISTKDLPTKVWSTHEWLHFIRSLNPKMEQPLADQLNRDFGLSKHGNSEIRFAWLMSRIAADDASLVDDTDQFLGSVGRRKFVLPLYRSMSRKPEIYPTAKDIYKRHRSGYHAVTRQSVDELFNTK